MTAVVLSEDCLLLPSSCTLSSKKPVLMEGKSWNILEDNMHFHSDFSFPLWFSAAGMWGL